MSMVIGLATIAKRPCAVDRTRLEMAKTQKTAIAIGASQGIGAGVEEAFLKRDYRVVANSLNISKANPFQPSVNLPLVDGDIGDPNAAAKIADTALCRFGRIDVLINNAGLHFSKPPDDHSGA